MNSASNKDAIQEVKKNIKSPAALVSSLSELLKKDPQSDTILQTSNLDELVSKHQHLFMQTSDTEFWERESVSKLASSFKKDDTSAASFRIFKHMHMRSAALGLDSAQIEKFMHQGIRNTLSNRSMLIEGSKLGGIVGSVTGNIMSTSVSAALAKAFANPALLFVPVDPILMPIGYAAGLIPGAVIAGPLLGLLKKFRESELGQNTNEFNAIPVRITAQVVSQTDTNQAVGEQGASVSSVGGKTATTQAIATYTSASPTLITRTPVQKPSVVPLNYTFGTALRKAHAPFARGLAKELGEAVIHTLDYAFHRGLVQAVEDLVVHRPVGKKKSSTAAVTAPPANAEVTPANSGSER